MDKIPHNKGEKVLFSAFVVLISVFVKILVDFYF